MDERDGIRNLIKVRSRHLQKLKEQNAKFGLHTPPHILTEIEDIETEIEKLQEQLGDLGNIAQRREDKVLTAARNLFTSLRTLDNGIHEHLNELLLFRPDWSEEQRKRIVKKINDFANREEIIDDVRTSLKKLTLGIDALTGEEQSLVVKIRDYGASFLMALSSSPVTPFPDYDTLTEYLLLIESARDDKKAKQVVEMTTQILKILDRKNLAEMLELITILEARME